MHTTIISAIWSLELSLFLSPHSYGHSAQSRVKHRVSMSQVLNSQLTCKLPNIHIIIIVFERMWSILSLGDVSLCIGSTNSNCFIFVKIVQKYKLTEHTATTTPPLSIHYGLCSHGKQRLLQSASPTHHHCPTGDVLLVTVSATIATTMQPHSQTCGDGGSSVGWATCELK